MRTQSQMGKSTDDIWSKPAKKFFTNLVKGNNDGYGFVAKYKGLQRVKVSTLYIKNRTINLQNVMKY